MITEPYGQEPLISFFRKALSNGSLNHAYIIQGDTGIGKRTLARYFAMLALCQNGNGCGQCPSCRQIEAGANPDLTTISPDEKNSIKIEAIREMISSVSYRAFHGGRKVYIIESADLLTHQAQNALLKIIEEPPYNVMFFLLCSQRTMLLPTITSRAQTLKMAPLSKNTLLKIAPQANDFQLTFAKGNPGKLLKLCADEEFQAFRDEAVRIIGKAVSEGGDYIYDASDFFEKNKELKDDLFTITLYLLRDALCKKLRLDKFIVNTDKMSAINKISDKKTAFSCMKALEAILEAESSMGKYGNYNLAVQTMLIKCSK